MADKDHPLMKLKVAELKSKLEELELSTKGNKPVLVQRLQDALDQKEKDSENNESEEQTTETPQQHPVPVKKMILDKVAAD